MHGAWGSQFGVLSSWHTQLEASTSHSPWTWEIAGLCCIHPPCCSNAFTARWLSPSSPFCLCLTQKKYKKLKEGIPARQANAPARRASFGHVIHDHVLL